MPASRNQNELFLNRLTEITEANLTNAQFGVAELAKEMGMSRSHIHRQLKTLSNQSLSQFIREIRLEKAISMLESERYTVAEIAYEVGFGSPSYFIKCFHQKYGYSPGEYAKNSTAKTIKQKNEKWQEHLQKTKTKLLLNKWLVASIFLVVLCGFLGVSLLMKNKKSEMGNSIVVMPLKYTGDNEDMKILSLGMMDDILNRLSKVKGLQVKSRISAEKYGQTNLSIPEIAREMNVAYVLEGTIFNTDNLVRVSVHLIDVESDNPLWSKQYDRDLDDIFTLVTDVSMKITEELEVVLTPEEVKQIEKVYTVNAEAYRLYQKGRFFWHKRTEEDLHQSIFYFNEALQQDSSFALAYAGLADSYFVGAWWKWFDRKEGFATGKFYAKLALKIDKDLAEPYATLGAIACWFDYDWESAKELLWKAIELNPNNADVNQYISEYYALIGNSSQARKYINKAIELDSHAKVKYYESSLYYYDEEEFEKALLEGFKTLELDRDFRKQILKNFIIFVRMNQNEKAMENIQKLFRIDFPDVDYRDQLQNIYENKGMETTTRWAIEKLLERPGVDYYFIAQLFALFEDKESTLEYLKLSYHESSQISRMKSCYDFRFLRDDPQFIALLEKMNLHVN